MIALRVAELLVTVGPDRARRGAAVRYRAVGEFSLGLPDPVRRGVPVLHHRRFRVCDRAGKGRGRAALAPGRDRVLLRRRRRPDDVERRGRARLHRTGVRRRAPVQPADARDRARRRPAAGPLCGDLRANPSHAARFRGAQSAGVRRLCGGLSGRHVRAARLYPGTACGPYRPCRLRPRWPCADHRTARPRPRHAHADGDPPLCDRNGSHDRNGTLELRDRASAGEPLARRARSSGPR